MDIAGFSKWLQLQLDERGWSQADLSKQSGISAPQIARLMNGTRGIGPEACTAIAKALRIPPESVYRAAGLLPQVPESNAWKERILHLAEQLPEEEYNDLVAYIEMRIRLSKEREKANASKQPKPAAR